MRRVLCSVIGLALLLLPGCAKKTASTPTARNYAVIAIEGDADNFNPLFTEDATAGEINDLLFPNLTTSRFDAANGILLNDPLLARSWEFSKSNTDLTFHLRPDVKWLDGPAVTARDIQYSYDLYADTSLGSVRENSTEMLKRTSSGAPEIDKAVEVLNDSTVTFHFDHAYPGEMFDAGLPVLPSHVFEKLTRKGLRDNSTSRHPLTAGPFALKEWKPMEQIVLASNASSKLPYPAKLSQMIFRIIPDYSARLAQLKSGEIDVLPYISVDDALQIPKTNPQIGIFPMGERFYDAINWNTIDGSAYAKSGGKKIIPNALFGSANVRRALTMAINRKEIIDAYIHQYGRESVGPISPLFRWAYNDTLKPLQFDPNIAATLLKEDGWIDGGNGVLQKNGRKFSFVLKVAAGNELRMNIASIVQKELQTLKIDMKIEQVERSAFWADVMDKKFDACIAGFNVPLQMQLDDLWGSDLTRSRFNLTSFRNKRVDEILAGAKTVARDTDCAGAWKEFQVILQREQPCTFLYWMNDLVAVNNRLKGTNIGVLGIYYHAADWYIDSTGSIAQRTSP